MSFRTAIDQINKDIKALEDERLEIQTLCAHKKTHEVDYMWRVGAILPAIICCACDKVIEFKM